MRDKFEKIVIGLQIALGVILAATLIKVMIMVLIDIWF